MPRFALIGYPIAHSQSPSLFSAAYCGRYIYDLVETDDFDQAWESFLSDYDAINITAPFKELAYARADIISPDAKRVGACNICVKTAQGIVAYNSDYLGVKTMLSDIISRACPTKKLFSVAVIGYGGAGKAALAAAQDLGLDTQLYRHSEIADGVQADIIIYTLPRWATGADKLQSEFLLEANYRDPVLQDHCGYIPGSEWLLQQALSGYELMTGEKPTIISKW